MYVMLLSTADAVEEYKRAVAEAAAVQTALEARAAKAAAELTAAKEALATLQREHASATGMCFCSLTFCPPLKTVV
jgi:hypothetical protein